MAVLKDELRIALDAMIRRKQEIARQVAYDPLLARSYADELAGLLRAIEAVDRALKGDAGSEPPPASGMRSDQQQGMR
jgi:hypothetical protein